jgi:putative ABC transport system ATP-binding protein
MTIQAGERVFIAGPSGSGKTTLLSLLAGVITPQQGSVTVLNQRINGLGSAARDRFRADHIGFVFHLFNLLPYLSVVENVTLPCLFSRRRVQRIRAQGRTPKAEAQRLLRQLNLTDPKVLNRPVTELSVGQQQRVAAARALIGGPEILIADEPTSSLDAANRCSFLDLLFRECQTTGATLLFVSHDTSLASRFDRTVHLEGSASC